MKRTILSLLITILIPLQVPAQERFRVMFYNVENLFDTEKDEGKNDEEFLPTSKRYWNNKKYYLKQNNIAKVISSVGEWNTPALIGICEVENERVLNVLTRQTPLKSQQYKFIITDCEDRRGIDVALLYQPDQFKVIGHQAYKIRFKSPQKISRDILHVYGLVKSNDTLDVFVCHFPSKSGGEKQTEPDRIRAAEVLRSKIDSLHHIRKHANIIIMGDFNDNPSMTSMHTALGAINCKDYKQTGKDTPLLYNLFYPFEQQEGVGSYKYRGQWEQIDQIIVSRRMLEKTSGCYVNPNECRIYNADFLLTEDKSQGGLRPKRTYFGMKYESGFSDHLPIYADFYISIPQHKTY